MLSYSQQVLPGANICCSCIDIFAFRHTIVDETSSRRPKDSMAFSVSLPCCTTQFKRLINITTIPNNGTTKFVSHKDSTYLYITVAICSVALLLNAVEIAILTRSWKKLSIFEMWLFNLAASDGLVAVSILIFEIIRFATNMNGRLFDVARGLAGFIGHFSAFSSMMTITFIAVDRLIAVKYPLKHKFWVTKKKVMIAISMLWAGNIVYSIIEPLVVDAKNGDQYSARKGFRLLDSFVIVIMGLIFVLAYSLIIYSTVIRWKSLNLNSNNANQNIKIQNIVVLSTCVLVVITYMICLLPYAISYLMDKQFEIYDYNALLVYSNTALDPLVYFFKKYLGMILIKREALKRSRKERAQKVSSSKTETSL